jgi:hypothetical protein
MKRALGIVFFLLLGGALIFFGGKQIAEGFASRNWLPVQGRVIDSHVDTRTVTKKSGNSRRTVTEYVTTIRYSYTVAGREFTGDRINVESGGYTGTDRSAAYNLAGRYPVGVAVLVHYDPRNPSTAVLQAGAAGFGSWILAALGLLILAATLVIALALRRRSPAPNVAVRVPPPSAAIPPGHPPFADGYR